MENNLVNSIIHVCTVLNKYAVQYMIVGGTAVALHGYFRRSTNTAGIQTEKPDLDLWYNPTYDNYFKLLNALEELGQDVLMFREEQTPDPKKSFFKYEFDKFTLDLLPGLQSKLTFKKCFKERDLIKLDGVNISFINLDALLFDKEANPRLKDTNDVEELKKLRWSED